MSYPYGFGPPPGWGPTPQFDYPRSNVVYVPVETGAKNTDDPATQMIKTFEAMDRVKKLLKEDKPKDGDKKDAKGLSLKETWLLMTVLSLPMGALVSTIATICVQIMKHNASILFPN